MGGSNKERKSRGGHGLFDWDKIRDDRWKGVYLGSSVHGISSRYTKVKGILCFVIIDLEWYKKVDGKSIVVDSHDEMDEIKRKEEEAFAQALGYSSAPVVKKSVPAVSKEELKQVITATNANYNNDQGGIGYSNAALKDFKDSIKDHLQVPEGSDEKSMYKSSLAQSKRALSNDRDERSRDYTRKREERRRSPSPIESYARQRDKRRSPSPVRKRDGRDSRDKYKRSPSPRGYRRNYDKKPYSKYDKNDSNDYSRKN